MIENRQYNPQKELLLKQSPYLRELLTFDGSAEERWTRIGTEASAVRQNIDRIHGKTWDMFMLRPLARMPERMGLLNPELGTTLNRDITIGLVYAGFEVGNVSNLEMVIDDLYEVLRKDGYIGEAGPNTEPQTEATKASVMDAFIGEALDNGMFLNTPARIKEMQQRTQVPPAVELFVEGMDLDKV